MGLMKESSLNLTKKRDKDAVAVAAAAGEEEEIVVKQINGSSDEAELCYSKFFLSLPKERGWRTSHLYMFQNFWCQEKEIRAIIAMQKHLQPNSTDIYLATIPKSGTTWLKALVYALMNRDQFSPCSKRHPLLASNPHELVPFLEYKLFANNQIPDLSGFKSPRILATHVPYPSLPSSIKQSDCKVVYLCRNPFDTFISSWHFIKNVRSDSLGELTIEVALDMFAKGIVGFGPFWKHMLGYRNACVSYPENVLFLQYEDMMKDIKFHMKKLAKFLGCPFSSDEESDGTVIEEITKLCSFDNMRSLEANKSGQSIPGFDNKSLFRKGKVGDWKNHFSPTMEEKLSRAIEKRLGGSGLSFKLA